MLKDESFSYSMDVLCSVVLYPTSIEYVPMHVLTQKTMGIVVLVLVLKSQSFHTKGP